MQTTKFQTVDEYISTFSGKTKEFLKNMRAAIKKAAPDAEEVISYNIPAFKLQGMLVWYAGYKAHVGFYPRSSVIDLFKKELEGYKLSKGTIQFPLDQPLPFGLITRIVKLRVRENEEAAAAKVKAKAPVKAKAKAKG